jgi:hypothetical protein
MKLRYWGQCRNSNENEVALRYLGWESFTFHPRVDALTHMSKLTTVLERRRVAYRWQPELPPVTANVPIPCLTDNMGPFTYHNPTGLRGLLQGFFFVETPFYLQSAYTFSKLV